VTGVTIYDQSKGIFEFHKGPVFASIVLADEINRASPKTQSSLLEVMEEGVVTVDGVGYPVGSPFMVIATQNPIEQAGTYTLPEAQLDRFLIKTSLGYPDDATALSLLLDPSDRARANLVKPIIAASSISSMSQLVGDVHVESSVMEYVNAIVSATRSRDEVTLGVSMRGAMALARATKGWALSNGRSYVIPDDVRELAVPVLAHRVIVDPEAEFAGTTGVDVITRILAEIEPPAYRAA
jgi:MoxR-like ATPase